MHAVNDDAHAPQRRMRKDVARNRALLLSAADALIAERGVEITLHDIAAAAGVGVGTVYRHFSDRDALLGALMERRFDRVAEILGASEQIDEPVEALRHAVLAICEFQQDDRGVWHGLLARGERYRATAQQRLEPVLTRMVERARGRPGVRLDLDVTDILIVLWVAGALTEFSAEVRPGLWRRYINTLIAGVIDDQHNSAEPPLTIQELNRIGAFQIP